MSTHGIWRDLNSSLPWVKAFNDGLRDSQLPHLTGRDVVIATDSSGQHHQNPFEVLSLLILDLDSSESWEILRQQIRRDILQDSRRMSFKQLSEPVRQRALIPFLCAADEINGLCLSIAVNKKINVLGGGIKVYEKLKQEGILKASWTFESFERMARITHFVSLLIGGLSSEGQNIYWISDQDEMFGSPKRIEDAFRLLSSYFQTYVNWPMGNVRVGTTKMDEGDRSEEDFAAIPDLAAGALAELAMRMKNEAAVSFAEIPTAGLVSDVSSKSDILLSWLSDNTQMLKRTSLVFDRREDGKFRIVKIWSKKEFGS
ncbi:MAG: hypothetical protein WBW41_18820 [Verrucomicrobiia bacterium]